MDLLSIIPFEVLKSEEQIGYGRELWGWGVMVGHQGGLGWQAGRLAEQALDQGPRLTAAPTLTDYCYCQMHWA